MKHRTKCAIGDLSNPRGSRPVSLWVLGLIQTFAVISLSAQQPSPNPSEVTDASRSRPRIEQTETPGRRIDLKTLPGATLFLGPGVKANKSVPLVIHFHGAAWLIQHHVAQHFPRAALITVQLGTGSSVYGRPFGKPEAFDSVVEEAGQALGLKRKWSSITLIAFSAGYGAVRAILRNNENFARVNNVLLLDGIHAGYSPEGVKLAEGGAVNAMDLDSFVRFAREAVAGNKSFVLTHSEIFPGTYASTTECVDFVLTALDLKRRTEFMNRPIGMRQLSIFDAKGLHVRGYAGNTAPDHVDHLHTMPAWIRLLRIR